MSIKGILFDKDGTLIDVDGTWVAVYKRMLTELFATDIDGAERMMEQAGFDRQTQRFKAGTVLAGGTTRQLIDIWWPGLDEEGIAAKQYVMDVAYAPVVKEYLTPLLALDPILDELHAMGYVLGIATNDSLISARNHLEALEVLHRFDAIITADTVREAKPSGDMIRKFSELTGIPCHQIAMVGDNPHDIEEARNGGAGLAVAVLSGNAEHGDIAHLADHTLQSVAELAALLRRS